MSRSGRILHSTALTAACLAAAGAIYVGTAIHSAKAGRGVSASYAVGDRIDSALHSHLGPQFTVILFLRSTCPGCEATAPLIRRVIALSQSFDHIKPIVVSAGASIDQERQYVASLGLAVSSVVSVPSGAVRLRYIPAIVVADNDGRVRYAMEGAPDASDYAAIEATIASVVGLPKALQ